MICTCRFFILRFAFVGLLSLTWVPYHSKSERNKRDKNHNRQKMFRFGVSFGRNDLNLEGHLQMGYNSKTIKNYGPIEKQLDLPENVTLIETEPNNQPTETSGI